MAVNIKKKTNSTPKTRATDKTKGNSTKPVFNKKAAEGRIKAITDQISALSEERYKLRESIILDSIYPFTPGQRLVFSGSKGKEVEGILRIEPDTFGHPALFYYPIKKDGNVSATHRAVYHLEDILREA